MSSNHQQSASPSIHEAGFYTDVVPVLFASTDAEREKARRTVATNALNVDDCRLLLNILNLEVRS